MDAVLLSRIQFAVTVGFHFIFPPLTIGLAWFIAWMVGVYRKTDDIAYRNLAKFWLKIFTVTFGIGVASGLSLEFQFGTNWAGFSRFAGGIFGVPLAAEGIFAFFFESIFLGVLLFGWDRVSRNTLWWSALSVATGATLSAFWILVANSWMQTPTAYIFLHNHLVLTNFWAAIFNPSTVPRLLHTVMASLLTGSFFVLGISAWLLKRTHHIATSRATMTMALVVAFIASLVQLGIGHYHTIQVMQFQPEKLATFEGLYQGQTHAPVLIFGIPDATRDTMHYQIRIPGLLSFLCSGRFSTYVKGLDAFPRAERPPILLTFYPFHFMVIIGMYFIGFTSLGMWLLWRKQLFTSRFYLALAFFTIPFPFLANELGWMAAEVGRQPWIVYRLLKTRDAISVSVPASQILISLIMFIVLYTLLLLFWLTFLQRTVRRGPEANTIGAVE